MNPTEIKINKDNDLKIRSELGDMSEKVMKPITEKKEVSSNDSTPVLEYFTE